ncbi:MAG: hypothetical protein FRX49_08453 [Trebouxia sp. A1-2]|nr:MAG: hypothetical protein FRX49_08453 [Trebouxia sp. A1-2]
MPLGRVLAGLPAVIALKCLLATYLFTVCTASKVTTVSTAINTLGWNVTDQTFHHIYTQGSQLQYQQSPSLTPSQLSAPAKGFLRSNPSPGSCTNWVDEHVIANLVTGIDPRNFYHFMFNIFQPIFDSVLRQQASMHGGSLLQFLAQCMDDKHPACPEPTCAVLRTDILVAVHGQALANVMFMKPGSVVIEVFPYGWVSRSGSFWRCCYYRDMVEARRMAYLPYTNDNYSKSFVDTHSIAGRPVDGHFLGGLDHEMIKQESPTEGKDLYVIMKNQNTEVDVSALQALLQVAANLLHKPVGRRFGEVEGQQRLGLDEHMRELGTAI